MRKDDKKRCMKDQSVLCVNLKAGLVGEKMGVRQPFALQNLKRKL